jgi:hypothetical protein
MVGIIFLVIKSHILDKRSFKIMNIYFYKYQLEGAWLKLIKYYSYLLPARYAFSILYVILEIIKNNGYFALIKILLTRIVNITFIYIFGFPVLVLEVSNKLYTRIHNSLDGHKIDLELLKINLNSMFFFDFAETLYVEKLEI